MRVSAFRCTGAQPHSPHIIASSGRYDLYCGKFWTFKRSKSIKRLQSVQYIHFAIERHFLLVCGFFFSLSNQIQGLRAETKKCQGCRFAHRSSSNLLSRLAPRRRVLSLAFLITKEKPNHLQHHRLEAGETLNRLCRIFLRPAYPSL